jgi:hypothetical protein
MFECFLCGASSPKGHKQDCPTLRCPGCGALGDDIHPDWCPTRRAVDKIIGGSLKHFAPAATTENTMTNTVCRHGYDLRYHICIDCGEYELTKQNAAKSAEKLSNPKDVFGVKKAPMSTVSAVVLAEIGVAMAEGAAKYGRHNYRAVGVRSSVYYDATMRHLMAWWEGEDIDPESGMSHIVKAITSLVVLRDAQLFGMATDDRPPACIGFQARLNELTAEILARHADKHPHHYTQKETGADRVQGIDEPPYQS